MPPIVVLDDWANNVCMAIIRAETHWWVVINLHERNTKSSCMQLIKPSVRKWQRALNVWSHNHVNCNCELLVAYTHAGARTVLSWTCVVLVYTRECIQKSLSLTRSGHINSYGLMGAHSLGSRPKPTPAWIASRYWKRSGRAGVGLGLGLRIGSSWRL